MGREERGGNDASTTCETALKERESKAGEGTQRMRKAGSGERGARGGDATTCLSATPATCYSRKMGFKDVERDRPDTTSPPTSLQTSSFTQLLSTLSFTSKG